MLTIKMSFVSTYFFKTGYPFATKLSFSVDHHKQERSALQTYWFATFKVTVYNQDVTVHNHSDLLNW